jgi:hypothetical protein
MSEEIIFITSSTKKMYEFSGIKLLKSFIKHQQNNKLIYFTENFKLDIEHDNIIQYDIINYPFLKDWLVKFKHIIPIQFGGIYDYTKDKHARKKGLYPQKTKDWNYKCSLWFRKIASLHYTKTFYGNYQKIIWLDNDCIIQKELNKTFIDSLFANTQMFYFLGKKRKSMDFGVEAGFIGWKKCNQELCFLQKLFEFYINGDFIKEKRWDDGYVIKRLLELHFINYGNDISKGSKLINVMEVSYITEFIIHKKGVHWKNNIDY